MTSPLSWMALKTITVMGSPFLSAAYAVIG
jgi:hypothetical protein